MSQTDPIADMLTRIRNAVLARKKDVEIPSSRIKVDIARILKEEGYIKSFKVVENKKQGILTIGLKSGEGSVNAISGLRRVSRPGCRIYCTKGDVPKAMDGLGITLISTSRGIITGKKCEELGIGGEVLCHIW
ncbi:MAG: 30S ribosomal protein S8 [Candidatus Aminicenantes bacterium RBG_13_62_12]|nr:MAG: 30S ribosomal protein S8 [Candidatus Aminicenantes bacterium RBG_13_62_12]